MKIEEFIELLECIEDNNERNGSRWDDWENAYVLLDFYSPAMSGNDIGTKEVRKILQEAIESNGLSLGCALPVLKEKYGQKLAGSVLEGIARKYGANQSL